MNMQEHLIITFNTDLFACIFVVAHSFVAIEFSWDCVLACVYLIYIRNDFMGCSFEIISS